MTPMIYGAEKTKPHISSGTMLARRRNAAAKKQIRTTFFLLAKHPTKLRIKTCVIFSHFSTLIVGTLINRRIYMKVLELQLQNNDFLKIYKKNAASNIVFAYLAISEMQNTTCNLSAGDKRTHADFLLMLDSCRLIFERSHFERSQNRICKTDFPI